MARAILTLALGLLLPNPSSATSNSIVISQIYGAGGNTGATFNADYVELFNRGFAPVSLAGKSLQYGAPTGNFGALGGSVVTLSGTVNPGQYFLVRLGNGGANGIAGPTPDATSTINMNAADGKIAIVGQTPALACGATATPCNAAQLALIVDLVGYGAANLFEGAGAAPSPSTTNATFRKSAGCTETDQNNTDFQTLVAAPRNTASALNPCVWLSVNDVSVTEGNSGTIAATFTVSLSAPAQAGGVTFSVVTADGAALAPSDYVALTLPGQTIPAGSSTASVAVTVNGDATFEADETFSLNINGVVGAFVADGVGLGTILNDDCPVITISPSTLPNVFSGSSYNQTLTATGGVGPYTFTSASVPPGLGLSTGGVLSGVPTAPGSYTFVVNVTASNGCPASQSYTIVVGTPILAGDLAIREFRWWGTVGPLDEYVEITNRTLAPVTVLAVDGSAGLALRVESEVSPLFVIPNGVTIQPGGYYLGANCAAAGCPGGYSLSSYANPDAMWIVNVPNGTGMALLGSSTALPGTTITYDAVGFATSGPNYKEGAGLVVPGEATGEAVYIRETPYAASGVLKDTGDNASDFFLADTNAGTYGPVVARLGSPGPQNAASGERSTGLLFTLPDPTKSGTTFPNRYRVGTTYYFRWKVTNNTGVALTRLRIRVADTVTLNSPGYSNPLQADFRLTPSLDSTPFTVPAGTVTALGLTLEAPTGLPNDGGYNSSAFVTALPGGVLLPGASVYVNVALRYPRGGSYTYWLWADGRP